MLRFFNTRIWRFFPISLLQNELSTSLLLYILPGHPDIVEDYGHLLTLENLGKTSFIPRGLRKRINVRDVLDGVRAQSIVDMGIPPHLSPRLRSTLLRCAIFASDAQVHALFVDARLHPWRDTIPDAATPDERVDALIDRLYDQQNRQGESALLLFLHVLADRLDPEDANRRRIHDLMEELAYVFKG